MTNTAEKITVKPHHTGHRKRLRERFLTAGPEALADYELLEMILFPAKPMGDVKPMAKALLAKFGSFSALLNAAPPEMMQVEGVNEAAVVAIKVAKAASARLLREEIAERPVVNSWDKLINYCRVHIGNNKEEEFHVLFLNSKLELLLSERQQKGTVNHTPVYPREVVKRALEVGASSMILVHNHPSGDVRPSRADVEVTGQIVMAARALGIEVHDHVIIGAKKHYSFRAEGLLA
ncbi:MAG: JAB domain-containing protein [Proteobacteria bacterium]|nr:JAB domain-containing protein [Pseudomonadota bacterium]